MTAARIDLIPQEPHSVSNDELARTFQEEDSIENVHQGNLLELRQSKIQKPSQSDEEYMIPSLSKRGESYSVPLRTPMTPNVRQNH